MFELFKFKRNNKNGKSYAVAKSNLKFRYRGSSLEGTNNPQESKSEEEIKEEISYLQTTLRYNNLKVYQQNIKAVKKRRFAIYTAPAIFLLCTTLFWLGPDSYEHSKTYDTYIKEEIQFSDGKMLEISDGITYCYGELDRDFKEDNYDLITNRSPYFQMYVLDNGEGIYAPYSFSGNELLLDGQYINVGTFVIDDINALEGETINDKYSDMFDRALDILIESKKVNKDYRGILESVDRDTKEALVARLVQYELKGTEEVMVVTPAIYFRVVSTIVTALYLFIFGIPALTKPIIDCYGIEVDGPKLKSEDSSKQHRFSELPLEYRSAFIAAETNRINEIARIADEYLTTDSKEMLFTEFEKKLILK